MLINIDEFVNDAKAFKKKLEGMHVLFTWKWLNEVEDLHKDTNLLLSDV